MLLYVTLTLTPDLEGQPQGLAEVYALSECLSSCRLHLSELKMASKMAARIGCAINIILARFFLKSFLIVVDLHILFLLAVVSTATYVLQNSRWRPKWLPDLAVYNFILVKF